MDALRTQLSELQGLRGNVAGLQAIVDALADGEVEATTVGRLVEKEPAVGLSVLKLANSARFVGDAPVSDLRGAVTRIGFSELKEVVVAHQARLTFAKSGRVYGLAEGEAWRGALAGALGAELVAEAAGGCDPGAAFTGALYRDCGKLAIDSLPDGAELMARLGEKADEAASLELEREILGHDHPTIGAVLAELWGLPEDLSRAIASHHEPPGESPDTLSDCVHCGDSLAAHMGYGTGSDGLGYSMDAAAFERLGLGLPDFLELLCETNTRLEPYLELSGTRSANAQEAA